MKNKIYFFIVCFMQTFYLMSQNCNCETNFKWVKKTFEDNDAGFQYALDTKGKSAYEAHNKAYLQRVKQIQNNTDCQKALREWLAFFRVAHWAINPIAQQNTPQTLNIQHPEPSSWETVKLNVSDFEKDIITKKETDLEGIWETGSYKIGIKKFTDGYIGFIINSENPTWKEQEVKLRINLDRKSATYYLGDKTPFETTKVQQLGNSYLQIDFVILKRLLPRVESEKNIEEYINIIEAQKPFISQLNKTTLLFRIPSFNGSKVEIDSVIRVNKDKIATSEYLIIDIRNNGGGSDRNYKEIMPFLYTNPIREVGVSMYSTKQNNQRLLDFISDSAYGFSEEEKRWAKRSYDTLQKHIGEFVNLKREMITIDTLTEIFPYPKNVGIIINQANGSTAEQFLLAAKQSKKVKLFGVTTAGVLDISNMYFIKSPCNEFDLGYSLSKSFRIPDMAIDGKGIMPDYYIDKEIKDYEWIDYVSKILN